MSRHIVSHENTTWVFGWDQMLMSFFLQVHDNDLPEEENPVVWLMKDMYEVEDLVQAAKKEGLTIGTSHRTLLYGEKDDGV